MWNVQRAAALLATFIVAGTLVLVFSVLPPIVGFLLAVAAAFGWCAWLETPGWPFVGGGVTIREADRTPVRSLRQLRFFPYLTDSHGFGAAVVAVSGLTTLFAWVLTVTDPTTVALSFLLIVVVVAAVSSWRVAVATSLMAFFSFNFFFLPPTGTLAIADAQHWVALFTLLFVSLVASYLSSEVRHRADEATKAEVARHSAELKSSLLASLGHDLKTPLTALTVAANNLNASWLTTEQRLEQAEVVRTELARLNRLFQNLIDMARIESHAVTAEREWVAPADVIEAAAQQIESALVQHRLNVDGGNESWLVRLDPRLTSAALAHVLENAAQHSAAGSVISVSVQPLANEIWFVVRDHGTGLSDQRRRAPRSSARVGSGMGLSISRGLLSAEGGRIWGESHPDGGAIFTLAVPVESRMTTPLEPELS
jgi:two-component system, OmpR family, sensor histidine kinase KdpD